MSNECCHVHIGTACVINCWEPCDGKYCKEHIKEMKNKTIKCQYYGCSFLCDEYYCVRHKKIRIQEVKEMEYNQENGLCCFRRNNSLCSKKSGKYKYCRDCSQYFKNLKKI